jgi:excinuclease ABC subunit B
LVAIFDADKEGFLRSERSLIQTIGRAARHVHGTAILYADTVTDSMRRAIEETERRRAKQIAYNTAHGITPRSVVKAVKELIDGLPATGEGAAARTSGRAASRADGDWLAQLDRSDPHAVAKAIQKLEREMKRHAEALEFEKAAALRDQLLALRQSVFGFETVA